MRAFCGFGVLCSLVALSASLSGVTRQQAPDVRLFNLTTAHGIEAERPWQPAKVFAPDDETVYLWYAADGCAIGTTISSTWLYIETEPPQRLASASVVVDRPGTWGQFNYTLAPGKQWAVGPYRIELAIGDVLMTSTHFRVSPAQTAGFLAPAITTEREVAWWREK